MKLAIMTVVLLGGCPNGAGDDFGVVPGTGGPTGNGSGSVDAAIDSIDSIGSQIVARACLLTDPRDPTSCVTTGAANLTVKLGTATATTADDGGFTMAVPSGSNLVWSIAGTGIYPSLVPFTTSRVIPAITTERYATLLADNGVLVVDQTASVFARVVHDGSALADATATVAPIPLTAIFYDGTSATTWDQDKTGAFGTVWVPQLDLASPTAKMVVTRDATATTLDGIPLRNQTITFVTIDR